jgi:dTDP-4-amino-4,6-dideoxygalactose transaminase
VSSLLEHEIEAVMTERLGRRCLFVPSGRVALYIALQLWFKPGDRLLMSSVTDDAIFFTVLAAGLRPVMAPLSAHDGNIAPSLVEDGVWRGLAGVLTTNLYGLPDRVHELRSRCDRLGIPLIEDAAHAIETTVDGRPIGTFGDAAVFSFSKHVGAPYGGIVAFTDDAARADLVRLLDKATVPERFRLQLIRAGAYYAQMLLFKRQFSWRVRWLVRRLKLFERRTYRMPLRAVDLARAVDAGPGLEIIDQWVRVDRPDYRARPSHMLLERALAGLRNLDADAARRTEAVDRFRSLPAVSEAVRRGDPQPLFRVPLLVDDRKAYIQRLRSCSTTVGWYIYDPPLDDYAGLRFADPSTAPAVARWWASHVLPVDPLDVARIMPSLLE